MKSLVHLRHAAVQQGERTILQGINLDIMGGEFVYLIGKTGSGKSSFLKTLYGALPLKKGTGYVAGHDLGTQTRRTLPLLRRDLGIVFQDFNLLDDRSIADNLNFVLGATSWKDHEKRKQRIQEVLRSVELLGKANEWPHSLSGGERQRVVIARALLNHPKLIIADEPTGNLDPETSDEILLLMRRLAAEQDTAVLFATHDYRILENFPARILRCLHGQIVEQEELSI